MEHISTIFCSCAATAIPLHNGSGVGGADHQNSAVDNGVGGPEESGGVPVPILACFDCTIVLSLGALRILQLHIIEFLFVCNGSSIISCVVYHERLSLDLRIR